MNSVKINVPEGYEIDNEKSTLAEVFFKKIASDPTTIEECLALLGDQDDDVIEYNKLVKAGFRSANYQAIVVIVKALNKGWSPDFNNTNQRKYYPWFNLKGGVSLSLVGYYDQYSDVPPSFLFKDEETVRYAIKHFLPFYKALYGN